MRRRIIALLAALLLALGMLAVPALAQGKTTTGNAANSLGKTTLDAEVGWQVGAGQVDGEFVTAEVQGIVIGLRAQHRFEGLLGVTGTNGNRVGVYEAATGFTSPTNPEDPATYNNGTWNYDFHVDLSGATGNAEGTTVSDYRLTLEQDFSADAGGRLELPMEPGVCFAGTFTDTLCQQSWNPGFGNTDFDPAAEGTYSLRLVLTPETFNGPPLAVKIEVNASHDASVVAFGDVTWTPTAGGNQGNVIGSRFIAHDDESGVVLTTNTTTAISSATTIDCVIVDDNQAWLSGENQHGHPVIFYVKDAGADSVFNQWTNPAGFDDCTDRWSGTSELLQGDVTVIASD